MEATAAMVERLASVTEPTKAFIHFLKRGRGLRYRRRPVAALYGCKPAQFHSSNCRCRAIRHRGALSLSDSVWRGARLVGTDSGSSAGDYVSQQLRNHCFRRIDRHMYCMRAS